MGLEKEVTTFRRVWESRRWTSITHAIREAVSKLSGVEFPDQFR